MTHAALRGLWVGWVVAILALADPTDSSAQEFLSGHEDLPLLAGLMQDRESVMVFDTPRGRVVETFAQTPETADVVLGAYDAALPQMGWRKTTRGRYVRDGETLTFEVVNPGPPTVLRILLTAD